MSRFRLDPARLLPGATARSMRSSGAPGPGSMIDQQIRGQAFAFIALLEIVAAAAGWLLALLVAPFDLVLCFSGRRPWPVTAYRTDGHRHRHTWLVHGWSASSAQIDEVVAPCSPAATFPGTKTRWPDVGGRGDDRPLGADAMVRRATADDAPEVVRLGARMFFEMGLPDTETGAWRAAAEARTATGLADGSVAAFVVDDPDRVSCLVASAAITVAHRLPTPRNPTGISAYVQYVCTEPSHRGQGLGRQVMHALIEWCRVSDVGVVELHTTPDGDTLYRSLGVTDGPSPALRLTLVTPWPTRGHAGASGGPVSSPTQPPGPWRRDSRPCRWAPEAPRPRTRPAWAP